MKERVLCMSTRSYIDGFISITGGAKFMIYDLMEADVLLSYHARKIGCDYCPKYN